MKAATLPKLIVGGVISKVQFVFPPPSTQPVVQRNAVELKFVELATFRYDRLVVPAPVWTRLKVFARKYELVGGVKFEVQRATPFDILNSSKCPSK